MGDVKVEEENRKRLNPSIDSITNRDYSIREYIYYSFFGIVLSNIQTRPQY